MPKPCLEFHNATRVPIDPALSTPTLITRILSHDPINNDKTTMLTHAPESSWGDPVCIHEYWEECYIISGKLYDRGLGKWFEAGSYCCRPPGMRHGPYLAGDEGCMEICWLRYTKDKVEEADVEIQK